MRSKNIKILAILRGMGGEVQRKKNIFYHSIIIAAIEKEGPPQILNYHIQDIIYCDPWMALGEGHISTAAFCHISFITWFHSLENSWFQCEVS